MSSSAEENIAGNPGHEGGRRRGGVSSRRQRGSIGRRRPGRTQDDQRGEKTAKKAAKIDDVIDAGGEKSQGRRWRHGAGGNRTDTEAR